MSESQFIYINFEDYHFKDLYNPDHLFAYIEKKIVKDCKYYLFFDEIQNVDNFELVINSFVLPTTSVFFLQDLILSCYLEN